MSTTLVTIAIALFNNENYVSRCLESVKNQTYKNLEIIIVDDGSTDLSIEKCKPFLCDARFSILQKENGGLSSGRQMGLDNAKGDYICFIDADDYLQNKYVETMLQQLKKTGADICLTSVQFENASGKKMDNEGFTEITSKTVNKVTIKDLAENLLRIRSTYKLSDSWNKMYKTSFIKDNFVKFELPKGYNGTDTAFNHKLVLHEPSYTSVSYPGYVHVIYANSAVHRSNKHLLEGFILIFIQIYEECRKLGILLALQNQLSNLYMEFVRLGMQDAYKETPTLAIVWKVRNTSKAVSNEYNIKISAYSMKTRGLVCFTFLYQWCVLALPLYLKVRSKLIKI